MITLTFLGYGVALPAWYLYVAAAALSWVLGRQAGTALASRLLH